MKSKLQNVYESLFLRRGLETLNIISGDGIIKELELNDFFVRYMSFKNNKEYMLVQSRRMEDIRINTNDKGYELTIGHSVRLHIPNNSLLELELLKLCNL